MRVGIIGGTGWLGSALGGRLLALGLLRPAELVLLNRSGRRAEYHGHADVTWAADSDELVAASDLVVISVRPQGWPALSLQASGRLVVSFMAAIGLDRLGACKGRIVRAMPNAAAEIGRSYSPWLAGPGVTDTDRAAVRWLLSAIGTADELEDEGQLDLMTAVPGSGAAYPALMAVALADYLCRHGIRKAVAWRAVEAVICDAPQVLAGRIDQAGAVVDTYLAYQGTTASGITAATAGGFTSSIQAALEAAVITARQMES